MTVFIAQFLCVFTINFGLSVLVQGGQAFMYDLYSEVGPSILFSYQVINWAFSKVAKSRKVYVSRRDRFRPKAKRALTEVIAKCRKVSQQVANATHDFVVGNEERDIADIEPPDDDKVLENEIRKVQEKVQRTIRREEISTAKASRWKTISQLFQLLVIAVVATDHAAAAESPVVALQHVLVSLNATEYKQGSHAVDHAFDSDSFLLAIDNCSSCCITNCLTDFVGKPQRVKLSVLGIGGNAMATYIGTIRRWSIEDDEGRRHDFLILNTYYNEQCPYRLLSPQHWAAEIGKPQQAWSSTDAGAVTLFWNQNKYRRTIALDGSTNVALLRTAPIYNRFRAFFSQISAVQGPLKESEFLRMPDVVVTDDEESVSSDSETTLLEDNQPKEQRHPDLPSEIFDHTIQYNHHWYQTLGPAHWSHILLF
jgi:hypothetical protein